MTKAEIAAGLEEWSRKAQGAAQFRKYLDRRTNPKPKRATKRPEQSPSDRSAGASLAKAPDK